VRVVAEAAKPSAAIPPARKFRRALFGKSFARSNDGAQQAHARKSLFDIGFCNIDRAGVSAFIPIPVFLSRLPGTSLATPARWASTRASLRQLLRQNIGIDGT
jgi:hypothetical protein